MKSISTIILILSILLVASCGDDDNPVTPTGGDFSLTVNIADQAGNPVEDLQIAVWNDLAGLVELESAPPTTTIPFSLAEDGDVSLTVFNLRGELVETVFDGFRAAGHFGAVWDGGEEPDGIYACLLSVTSPGSTLELFADTILAALRRVSGPGLGSLSPLGYSDANGSFYTADSLLFPNVLNLPALKSTNGVGVDLGTFSYLDSVTIELTDTSSGFFRDFRAAITNGANEINLIWALADSSQPVAGWDGDPREPLLAAASIDTAWLGWNGNVLELQQTTAEIAAIQLVFDGDVTAALTANTAQMVLSRYFDGIETNVFLSSPITDTVICFGEGPMITLNDYAPLLASDASTCEGRVVSVFWYGSTPWALEQNFPNPFK